MHLIGSQLWQELEHIRKREFDFLIFFVTGQCNALCQHCFYWENLGPTHAGLSLDKIERVATRMPAFRTLLLSGGEPSLRRDLPELVNIFWRHNRIRNVSVPTNGLLPPRIAALAAGIAEIDPGLHVSFNLSIDGFAATHDKIRGVPGNFEKSMATLRALRDVARTHPNLEVVVNTVICADNYQEVAPFARFLRSTGLVDGQFFEVVRGAPPEQRIKEVPPEALRQIYTQVLSIQAAYLRQRGRHLGRVRCLARRVTDLGGLIYRYRTQWSVHARGATWPVPCLAGEAIATIDYNGHLRVCELRSASVDLADYDYDFESARSSALMLSERSAAKSHTCDCTHVCFVNTSARFSARLRFLALPAYYLRYTLLRSW